MCGFVGFIDETEAFYQAVNELVNMTGAIAHRGPDGMGYYTEAPVAMGHRRLSIIDIEGGSQPMISQNGSLILVFNGEIYNYPSLRQSLTEKGYVFRTHSDSEVLLHGYAEYGDALPLHLRGMFAFAIWDKANKRMFAARDPFGIKPFYYSRMKDAFLFGSEIKSFLHHPAFEKKFNDKLLPSYLSFQFTPPCEETFFQGVYKLPPAHTLVYENGNATVARYTDLQFAPETKDTLSDEEWVDRVDAVIDDSVKAHKLADVEVCSFLSGGIDSSYIASIANVEKTFTVGFDIDGGKYSEIGYAKELSDIIGAQNISRNISADEYWNSLHDIQYQMDEPLADPSAVALYFLCELASRHCKVVLSGEGADELFGGYNIYTEPLTFRAYEKLIPYPIRHMVGKLAQKLPAKRGLNFIVRKGEKLEDRYIGNAFIFSEKDAKSVLKNTDSILPHTHFTHPIYQRITAKDPSTKMQTLDLNTWLIGDILQKADKMSMAHSLELRVPFLDKEVWSVARTLPRHRRTLPKETKVTLRRASLRHVPADWAARRKLGFPVPIRVWLKEDAYYNRVKDAFTTPAAEQFFNTDAIVKLLDDHKAGLADNSRKIYTLYTFLIWYKMYFEA